MRNSMREHSGKTVYAVAAMVAVMLAASGALAEKDDWGPFTGPWERYEGNPILPKEGDNYRVGMCPGPDSIIKHQGKLWMFIYNQDGHNTKLAVSEDGLEWEYVHDDPILEVTEKWEGPYALTKAVEVIDGKVYLYYFGKGGGHEQIGIAWNTDPDLMTTDWKKHPDNPIFTRRNLTRTQRVFPSTVMKDNGIYYFFIDGGRRGRRYPNFWLNVATSKDGIHFEPLKERILMPGPEGSWDDQAVSQAAVRKVDDWWYMIYSGFPKGPWKNAQQFGLARARKPEGPWEKYPDNPIFTATGNKEDWDGEFLQHACPVKIDGKWHLYYSGNCLTPNRNIYKIGLAIRADESGTAQNQPAP